MNTLTVPWAVEVGIITARDLASDHRPPLPSELLASFVVFGALAALAIPAPKAAAAAGWGLVVATVLSSKVDFLGPVGDFLSGKTTPGATGPGAIGDIAVRVGATPPPAVVNGPQALPGVR